MLMIRRTYFNRFSLSLVTPFQAFLIIIGAVLRINDATMIIVKTIRTIPNALITLSLATKEKKMISVKKICRFTSLNLALAIHFNSFIREKDN